MTVKEGEAHAEELARRHLDRWHPAVSASYAADVPFRARLLDLREVGLCRCAITGLQIHPETDTPATTA